MGLINNYTVQNQLLGRSFGGTTNPVPNHKPEVMFNYFSQPESGAIEQVKRDSFPTGTNPPYSLIMGYKGGLLSITTTLGGSGNISGNLLKGINLATNLSGSGTLSGNASLIVKLAANLFGSGTLTGSMRGVVQLAANLAGSGNMTAALKLIAGLSANIGGGSSLSANLKGKANMSSNIFVNSGTATTNELVTAIWAALAADNNVAGTMGQKLNGAGSAGDPWSTNLPASYVDGQAGKIMSQIQALVDELHTLKGLNASAPVTITPTSITATGIDIAIGGDGVNLSTLERQ